MSKFFGNKITPDYKIHRNIENNIDFVTFTTTNDNPLSNQGIKIGEKVYRLAFFEKHPANLSYFFEKNIILRFYNRGSCILIQLIYPKLKLNDVHVWDTHNASAYYSLSWNEITKELDYLNSMSFEYNEKHKKLGTYA